MSANVYRITTSTDTELCTELQNEANYRMRIFSLYYLPQLFYLLLVYPISFLQVLITLDNHLVVDSRALDSLMALQLLARMTRLVSVDDWKEVDWNSKPDGSWTTMMARVAAFHSKHDFANPKNNGHDMGYRVALTVEELGEFAAAITKGKPKEEASEELADLLILILGHSLAMHVDLESEFHSKMDKIMERKARRGNLGIRVTEYEGE